MSITEVVLIITLGYSPSSATHVDMQVLEYIQPNMKKCEVEESKVNKRYPGRFDYRAICIKRKLK